MKKIAALFAFFALALAPAPVLAQGKWGNSWTADEARDARDQGATVPLRDIFRRLKNQYGGYQIDANLYNRGNGQVYVVDWMTERGERLRITVDAQSGRIISTS